MSGIQDLAQHGRGNDTMMAHVTPGEMMVPPEMMQRHPDLQKHLYQAYVDEGMDPRQFKVGSGITSLNPTTGKAEFGFFKKLFKAAAPVVGYALGGPMGAAIGGGLAGASDGGGWKGAAKGAAIGYVGGSLAAGGAFGDTVAGYSGGGIGSLGLAGNPNFGGSAGSWGTGKAAGWLDGGTLGSKLGSNQLMAISALGALTTEPEQPGGNSHVPNTDKGDPFNIDRSDLRDTDGEHQSNAITDDTVGYGDGYTRHAATTQPVLTSNYTESPLIKPAELLLTNPNLTPEELMEYYKPAVYTPVKYAATGGMINQGTTGKADDVPIMASKGEFVMTADAVKNAGHGDSRMGAKKLYDLMYTLEGAR